MRFTKRKSSFGCSRFCWNFWHGKNPLCRTLGAELQAISDLKVEEVWNPAGQIKPGKIEGGASSPMSLRLKTLLKSWWLCWIRERHLPTRWSHFWRRRVVLRWKWLFWSIRSHGLFRLRTGLYRNDFLLHWMSTFRVDFSFKKNNYSVHPAIKGHVSDILGQYQTNQLPIFFKKWRIEGRRSPCLQPMIIDGEDRRCSCIDIILVGWLRLPCDGRSWDHASDTLDQMIYHASAVVKRLVKRSLSVVDIPFGNYQGN